MEVSRAEKKRGPLCWRLQIGNNLTNHAITSRNSAKAVLSHNVTKAQGAWFIGAASGDLHLASCTNASVDAKGAGQNYLSI